MCKFSDYAWGYKMTVPSKNVLFTEQPDWQFEK